MKIFNSKKQQIYFGNIKSQIRIGEQVLKEISVEYPNLNSSTKIKLRVFNLNRDTLSKEKAIIIKNLLDLSNAKAKKINMIRTLYNFESFDDFMKTLTCLIKKYSVANCGEMARIAQDKLLKKGIMADVVELNINNEVLSHRPFKDHSFVVTNLASNSHLYHPGTWGNKAVIVDPWLGECNSAKEMMIKFENMFKLVKDKCPDPV